MVFLLMWRWNLLLLLFSFQLQPIRKMETCEPDTTIDWRSFSVFRMNTYNGQIFPIRLWFVILFIFLIILRFFNQELVHLNCLLKNRAVGDHKIAAVDCSRCLNFIYNFLTIAYFHFFMLVLSCNTANRKE